MDRYEPATGFGVYEIRVGERWGGWRREPFAADSTAHVSVNGR